jgi:DNA invertase Pin-like site-specific DNA recombinase
MKKAIGYIRFSSDDQKDGNSIERQTDNITAYCNISSNGLNLIDVLIDDGFSASKDEHRTKGKLGTFLKEADQGKYAGYALVIEHMDRLSRLGIDETSKLLRQILAAGVEIHITQTNRVIRSLDDIVTALLNVLESYGAQEYSKKLSERIVKAWRSKRANMDSKPLTSLLPKWLKIENGQIVEVPEKVETVREIFRHSANGLGATKIRAALNGHGEGVTMGWITNTLQNRAVLGEFQPHHYVGGKRVPLGEVVFGYYPRVLSDEAWTLARTDIERKSANRKMVHGARNSDRAENLFTGMIFDATAESVRTMVFQRQKNKRGKLQNAFLVTSTAVAGPNRRLRYDRFEKAFLNFLTDLDWKAVSGEGEPEELKQKVAKLTEVTNDLATAKARCAARTAAMDGEMDVAMLKVLAAQLAKFEAQATDLEVAREAAAHEVESLKNKLATMESPEELLALISGAANNDIRLRLRSEIRRRISRIDLHFGLDGFKAVADVQFVNGVIRALIFTDKATLVIRGEGTI